MPARCSFKFLSPDRVRYTGDGYAYKEADREFALDRSGLSFETLAWLSNHVAELSEEAVSGDLLRLVGRNLFDFLLTDAPPTLREHFIGLCDSGKVSVELEFEPEAWALASLPWELLYVGRDLASGGFFLAAAADKELVLTRHVPHQPSLVDFDVTDRIRILVVVASPESARTSVRADELERFLEQLKKDCDGDAFDFEIAYEADRKAVQAKLEAYRPDIFHFRGHGERGALWLAAAEEEVRQRRAGRRAFSPVPIENGTLTKGDGVTLLFSSEPRPKLVVLEACESADEGEFLPGVAALLVRKVPAVVAMRFLVSQKAANEFVQVLYAALVEGKSVDSAVRKARVELGSRERDGSPYNDRSFGTPVLYVKASEKVCLPLPRKSKRAALKQVQPTGQDEQDCPRCTLGAWAGAICEVCRVWFVCPHCGTPIRRPAVAAICSSAKCGKELNNPPWPTPDSFGASLPRPA